MRAPTYADHLIGQGLKPKTVRNYKRELELAIAWFDGLEVDLRVAGPSLIASYAATRPHTHSVRSHLRSGLRWWWHWHGVEGWAKAVDIPSKAPMVCKALDPAKAGRLVSAAEGWWRAGTAVLVGAYLGLRNEEIAGMRWSGFDSNMEWYTLVGKGSKTRTLSVLAELAEQLDGRRNSTPWVFEGRYSGHVSHTTINNWVGQVAEAAGIGEHVWPHRLRHTMLADAHDNTKALRDVMRWAGHSRPETTAGYTRTSAEALQRVGESLSYTRRARRARTAAEEP